MRQVGGGGTTSKSSQLICENIDRDQLSPGPRVDSTGEESGGRGGGRMEKDCEVQLVLVGRLGRGFRLSVVPGLAAL